MSRTDSNSRSKAAGLCAGTPGEPDARTASRRARGSGSLKLRLRLPKQKGGAFKDRKKEASRRACRGRVLRG